jgi:hypothetical protein
LEARLRHSGLTNASFQEWNGISIGALDEQPLRRIAPPAIGARKKFHQLRGGGVCQIGIGRSARGGFLPLNPPKPPVLSARSPGKLRAQIGWMDKIGVLNKTPIKIDDIQGATRTVGEINRMKPGIR